MPYGLFVDAANVYWTNYGTGEVMQAKLDGTDPVALTTGEDMPISVQAAAGNVYWLSYSTSSVIRAAPVGGGAVVDLALTTEGRQLVIGASTLFWTHEPDDIQSIPVTGLPDGGTEVLLSGNALANGITVDASAVYWVDRGDDAINTAALDLTNEMSLALGVDPWDIAVDATTAYWTEQGAGPGTGRVSAASKVDGSNAITIASMQDSPAGIAVDATHVYWTNLGTQGMSDGTVSKAPIGGGATTVLAAGQGQPINVVVDETYVYWTAMADDRVMKVAK
jgi:hypothetical protein